MKQFWEKLKPILLIVFYIVVTVTGIYLLYETIVLIKKLFTSSDKQNDDTSEEITNDEIKRLRAKGYTTTHTAATFRILADQIYNAQIGTRFSNDERDAKVKSILLSLHGYLDYLTLEQAYGRREFNLILAGRLPESIKEFNSDLFWYWFNSFVKELEQISGK